MEGQHPIPQQISSYEFKLVGEMTLKQFLKAVIGIIIAVLIYKTKLLAIFKWPLMFVSGGLGLALAFVPFEDRPLETWVISFLKSIYSPTIYTYKKKNEDWLELSGTKKEEEETSQLYENKNANTIFKEKLVGNIVSSSKSYSKTKRTKEEEEKVVKTTPKQDKKKAVKEVVRIVEEKEEVAPEEKEEKINIQKTESVDLNLKKEKLEATGAAVFGNIPMPDRPDIPNIIVGMATNNEGKIIDGVIVEIQDAHGNPIRVIKTNALGQFKISTPLANGRYLMIAEKDGYNFDRVNIDLNNKIVDPVRIIAHN
jgi:hypothetical protein